LNPYTNGPELVEIGKSWNVSSAKNIVIEVCDAIKGFRSVAEGLGVNLGSVDKFAPDIEARARSYLKALQAPQQ
jgi:hypothetical protein